MLDWNRLEVLTFDCYGTLIDWERGILDALRPIMERHNLNLPEESLLELYAELETEEEVGPYKKYREVLKNIIGKMGQRLGFTPSIEENSCLADSLGSWPPFPDTVEALKALKGRYRLAVISNVDDDLFAETARRLEVPFDAIITAEQCHTYKPSLNNFQTAQKRLGVPADRILHVAQSLYHDIAPAKALGGSALWINRRQGATGSGATPPTVAQPDLELPDLKALAAQAAIPP